MTHYSDVTFRSVLASHFYGLLVVVKYTDAEKQKGAILQRHFEIHFSEWKLSTLKWNVIEICSLAKYVNMPALVQIMACRPTGDKPLSEPKHRKPRAVIFPHSKFKITSMSILKTIIFHRNCEIHKIVFDAEYLGGYRWLGLLKLRSLISLFV